ILLRTKPLDMTRSLISRPFIVLTTLLSLVFVLPQSAFNVLLISTIAIVIFIFFYKKLGTGASLYWLFGMPIILIIFSIRKTIHLTSYHSSEIQTEFYANNLLANIESIDSKEKHSNIRIHFNYQSREVDALLKYKKVDDSIKYFIGKNVLVSGNFQKVIAHEEFESFNYSEYLIHQHIHYIGNIDSLTVLSDNEQCFNINQLASSCNLHIQKIIIKFIPDESLAHLMIAIILGDKSKVSEKIKQQFIATGTAHILAVSGMHIGILYAILNCIFSFLALKFMWFKKIQSPTMLGLIWIFALITGLGASVLRAAVMFSLFEIGINLKRVSDSINIICGSAFLILFYNPCMIYDIGFQLSFFAVLSIILFYSILKRWFKSSNKYINYFLDIVNVSLAVQFLVTPISVYYFQSFPTYFLISNLIWVPLSFALMLSGLALLATSYVFQPLSIFFGLISKWCLLVGIMVFDFIEKLPFHQLSDILLFPEQAILLIMAILSINIWISHSKKMFLFVSIILLIVSNIYPMAKIILSSSKEEIIVYKHKADPLLDLHFNYNIISIVSSESDTIKKTYFQKTHFLENHSTINLANTNQFIFTFPANNSQPSRTIAIDSLNISNPKYNYLFIRNKIFPPEILCSYNVEHIFILPNTSHKIKTYYSKNKNQYDSQLTISEFLTQKIPL
ncbi:MAG: ComEC/Rec2 family competence protein, partial [Saprospiraceae bacterium]